MSRELPEPDKRRSPMDSGNNGTWIEKLAQALSDRRKAKKIKGKKKSA